MIGHVGKKAISSHTTEDLLNKVCQECVYRILNDFINLLKREYLSNARTLGS